MPSFDIVREIKPENSFRVSAIVSNFDLDIEHLEERFKGEIDPPDDWKVGLIVGGSGTGKTTIAKECFVEAYFAGYEYTDKPVIDEMPKASIKDIEKTFTSVGFSSPSSWLKPYGVLSNGEKMRVDLARCLLDNKELIVFDEFTSVVNRECAKTTSLAISKAIRRSDKKFIAVSCHDDVIDWLAPDWIYDTDQKRFFVLRGNSTAPKSSSIYIGLSQKIEKKSGKFLGSITI